MPSWKKVITSGSSAMLSSLYTSGDVSGSVSSVGSFGQVKAGTLSVTGNITTQGDIIAENYIVSSSVTYMTQSYSSGSTVFGNTSDDTHKFTGSLSTTGNIIPSADGTVDLGSDTKRFANLYTADIQLSNEQKGPNDIDGTTGQWTIQEGANDLFLINRRTGDKFKFSLEKIE